MSDAKKRGVSQARTGHNTYGRIESPPPTDPDNAPDVPSLCCVKSCSGIIYSMSDRDPPMRLSRVIPMRPYNANPRESDRPRDKGNIAALLLVIKREILASACFVSIQSLVDQMSILSTTPSLQPRTLLFSLLVSRSRKLSTSLSSSLLQRSAPMLVSRAGRYSSSAASTTSPG
jgi:hypothetical protein